MAGEDNNQEINLDGIDLSAFGGAAPESESINLEGIDLAGFADMESEPQNFTKVGALDLSSQGGDPFLKTRTSGAGKVRYGKPTEDISQSKSPSPLQGQKEEVGQLPKSALPEKKKNSDFLYNIIRDQALSGSSLFVNKDTREKYYDELSKRGYDRNAIKEIGDVGSAMAGQFQEMDARLKQDPMDHDALYKMGEIFLATRDYKRAKNSFTKILNEDPKNNMAAKQLGRTALIAKDYTQAASIYKGLADQFPDDPEVKDGLVAALYYGGQQDEARRIQAEPGQAPSQLEAQLGYEPRILNSFGAPVPQASYTYDTPESDRMKGIVEGLSTFGKMSMPFTGAPDLIAPLLPSEQKQYDPITGKYTGVKKDKGLVMEALESFANVQNPFYPVAEKPKEFIKGLEYGAHSALSLMMLTGIGGQGAGNLSPNIGTAAKTYAWLYGPGAIKAVTGSDAIEKVAFEPISTIAKPTVEFLRNHIPYLRESGFDLPEDEDTAVNHLIKLGDVMASLAMIGKGEKAVERLYKNAKYGTSSSRKQMLIQEIDKSINDALDYGVTYDHVKNEIVPGSAQEITSYTPDGQKVLMAPGGERYRRYANQEGGYVFPAEAPLYPELPEEFTERLPVSKPPAPAGSAPAAELIESGVAEIADPVAVKEISIDDIKGLDGDTPVNELPNGLAVEYNGKGGFISRDADTGEVLFNAEDGTVEIVTGGGDTKSAIDAGVIPSEGYYKDKHGEYYVRRKGEGYAVYKVGADGSLKRVYTGDKANAQRRDAIIEKALDPDRKASRDYMQELREKAAQLEGDLQAVKGTPAEPAIAKKIEETQKKIAAMEEEEARLDSDRSQEKTIIAEVDNRINQLEQTLTTDMSPEGKTIVEQEKAKLEQAKDEMSMRDMPEEVVVPEAEVPAATAKAEPATKPELLTEEDARAQEAMDQAANRLVEIEGEFSKQGLKIESEYDNQIIVLDKNDNILEPEDLPENLRPLAGEYEAAISKMGEYDPAMMERAMKKARGEEVPFEEVTAELPSGKEIGTVEKGEKKWTSGELEGKNAVEVMQELANTRPSLKPLMDIAINIHNRLSEIRAKAGGDVVDQLSGMEKDTYQPFDTDLFPFPYRLYSQIFHSTRRTRFENIESALDTFKEKLAAAEKYLENPPSEQELAQKKQEVTDFYNKKIEGIKSEQEAARKRIEAAKQAKQPVTDQEYPKVNEDYRSNKFFQAIVDKYKSAKALLGRKREIVIADGSKAKGQYKVVDANDIAPSHNPETYAKTKGVPVDEKGNTLNDRNYEADKQAQALNTERANNFNRKAIDNPIIVTEDGIVISGNDRTMARQKSAKQGTDRDYVDGLIADADMYGIDPAEVQRMVDEGKNPTLVFEKEGAPEYSTKEYARYNVAEAKGQNPLEKAVALSKKVDSKTTDRISTLLDGISNSSEIVGKEVLANLRKVLVDDGVISKNDIPLYFDAEGKMTAAGKDFLENLVLATVFDEPTLRALDQPGVKSWRGKLANAKFDLMQNSRLGDYNIQDFIIDAVGLKKEQLDSGMPLFDWLTQTNMFREPVDPYTAMTMSLLEGSRNAFKDFVKSVNERAKTESVPDMFGEVSTPEQVMTKALKETTLKLDENEKNAIEKLFAVRNEANIRAAAEGAKGQPVEVVREAVEEPAVRGEAEGAAPALTERPVAEGPVTEPGKTGFDYADFILDEIENKIAQSGYGDAKSIRNGLAELYNKTLADFTAKGLETKGESRAISNLEDTYMAQLPQSVRGPQALAALKAKFVSGELKKEFKPEAEEPIKFARNTEEINKIKGELDDLLGDFGSTLEMGGISQVDKLVPVVAKLVQLGYYKIADIAKYLVEKGLNAALPYLKDAYRTFKNTFNHDAEVKTSLSGEKEISDFGTERVAGGLEERSERAAGGRELPGQPGGAGVGRRPPIRIANKENLPPIERESVLDGQYDIDEVQRFGVNLAMQRFDKGGRGFLLADGAGVGKTREILVLANEMQKKTGKPSLIVTLKAVVDDSIKKDSKALGIDPSKLEIGTYDDLTAGKIGKGDYGVVIFDESHNLKNVQSERSSAASKIKRDHAVFASATPMDKPEHAVYFMSEVTGEDPAAIRNELGIEMVYVKGKEGEDVRSFARFIGGFDTYLARLIDKRNDIIKNGGMVRREYPFYGEINETSLPMPEPVRADIAKINEIYDKRYEDRENIVIGRWAGEMARTGGGNFLQNYGKIKKMIQGQGAMRDQYLARMREFAKNEGKARLESIDKIVEPGKIDHVFEETQKALAEGKKVVIVVGDVGEQTIKAGSEQKKDKYGFFEKKITDTLPVLLKKKFDEAGIKSAEIYGGNRRVGGVNKYTTEMERFNTGDADVVVMTAKSGGTGINLDDVVGNKPRKMIIATVDYQGDVFEQVIGRVSRRNTASPAEVVMPMMEGALSDTNRKTKVAKKVGLLAAINTGKADMDFERISTRHLMAEEPVMEAKPEMPDYTDAFKKATEPGVRMAERADMFETQFGENGEKAKHIYQNYQNILQRLKNASEKGELDITFEGDCI